MPPGGGGAHWVYIKLPTLIWCSHGVRVKVGAIGLAEIGLFSSLAQNILSANQLSALDQARKHRLTATGPSLPPS
eukprot:SAG22_NODE_13960_length_389_cov_1.175862_2_plen_74_part_01